MSSLSIGSRCNANELEQVAHLRLDGFIMSVAQGNPDLRENLADLREKSLILIALFAGALGYAWFLWVGWTRPNGFVLTDAWIGVGLLILSAVISCVMKDRYLHIATHLLVWSILGATVCAMLVFPSPELVYLFILPVIFASVLLSQPSHLLVAAVANLIILAIDLARVGISLPPTDVTIPLVLGALIIRLLSSDVAIPTAIITLVTAASWVSARNLYTAMTWVLCGYERARRNEEIVRERQGELRRALKALDEATHRLERVNYMLALARDQAEEARRLKQQFAQTISHELRTPLNLIVGFTELMTESPEYYGAQLPPAYLRDLNIVHRNACHLQGMINDVLDLARIEAAQMSLMPEEADPVALVQEAVTTARSLVEARGLALLTEIEPDLPRLWIDPTRIRQVLFNLLNNAAHFTDEGSVTVSARRQGEEVIFAVADTGVGIAPEDIARIFEEFQQADGGTRRRHGGAGLGLAISQRFVELHGGRIWAESQVGQGSTFHFSLPVGQTDLATAPGSRPAETTSAVSAKGGEELVLLAVTRSPAAAALLMRYVRGFRTVVVPDLDQAQHAARQLMPQAAVIDRACEKLDSERLEALVREWGLMRVPVVACPLPGGELLHQMPVDGYLIKPVSRRSVWDVLRQFGRDIDKVLVVDDDQDFVLLMSRILEDNPVRRYQVISAYNGQEGLTMVHHHQPDLVFLDLGLPDMEGAQVIERIRSNPRWQHIPVVVVSGQDEIGNQEALAGAIVIAKADGLMPAEIVRWIQDVVDTTVTTLPAPPASQAVPVP
jgi:signal transduction histidine kinase/CheY-like chemotaxis protein